MEDQSPLTDSALKESNLRHDIEHGDAYEFNGKRVRCSWNAPRMLVKGELTDKKIVKYAALGWFSEEFKKQRKLYWLKKRGQAKREGNFDIIEGRLIYRP